MHQLLLVLLYFTHLVRGISTNTTDSSCPQPDGTNRSIWTTLGSCASTLLICVWHVVHFNFDDMLKDRVMGVLAAFFAPEMVVMIASREWWAARREVSRFREKGYDWSMTHSFFAEMGGFVYHDDEGNPRTIDSLEFLKLCEEKKIANPAIAAKDIRDRSKSGSLGKIILTLQLSWFTIQVIVRFSNGLAVTLVELDILSMAVLSTLALFLWWNKPLRPECPHVFYSSRQIEPHPPSTSALSKAWGSEPNYFGALMAFLSCTREKRLHTNDEGKAFLGTDTIPVRSRSTRVADTIDDDVIGIISLCVTLLILGGLHLVAWSFDYLPSLMKILWLVASFVLATSPLVFFVASAILENLQPKRRWGWTMNTVLMLSYILGIGSRIVLVLAMFGGFASLPCSAYQTVSWTVYIPHL